MNLKTACIIAFILMAVSILLYMGGSVLFYAMLFSHQVHVGSFISPVISVLTFFILSGGFILLLIAIMNRLNKPDSGGAQSLFILAGGLILLATLINLANMAITSVSLFQHLPRTQFFHYLYMVIPSFLANLTLGLFAITQAGNISGKSFAAVTLILHVILLAIVLINVVRNLPNSFIHSGLIQNISNAAMSLGSLAHLAAIIFFLLMFLMHRPWPPQAEVLDPSPEPLPVLSAEAPLPEG